MKIHYNNIINEGIRRTNQLQYVMNCYFGLLQLSLRNMYILYIRSTLEYTAPALYPLMSNSIKRQIEILENKVLFKILGMPISTRISDLY